MPNWRPIFSIPPNMWNRVDCLRQEPPWLNIGWKFVNEKKMSMEKNPNDPIYRLTICGFGVSGKLHVSPSNFISLIDTDMGSTSNPTTRYLSLCTNHNILFICICICIRNVSNLLTWCAYDKIERISNGCLCKRCLSSLVQVDSHAQVATLSFPDYTLLWQRASCQPI